MSYSINRITILGRLGQDPEVRSVSSGKRVATLNVATTETWRNREGEKQEKTQWHRVIVWNRSEKGGLADVVEKYAQKGDNVAIEGKVEYRSWEDKEGQKRYTTEIVAENVVLLGGRSGGERAPATAAAPAGKGANMEDFPEALDPVDDDLPF